MPICNICNILSLYQICSICLNSLLTKAMHIHSLNQISIHLLLQPKDYCLSRFHLVCSTKYQNNHLFLWLHLFSVFLYPFFGFVGNILLRKYTHIIICMMILILSLPSIDLSILLICKIKSSNQLYLSLLNIAESTDATDHCKHVSYYPW